MRRKLLSRLTPQPSRVVIAVVIASLVFSAAAMAAAGDLDPTFSGDGKQTTTFGLGERDQAYGVAIQSDGKVVVVGGSSPTNGSRTDDFAIARYNPNGTLDTTFSGDGKQTTDFGGFDTANGVALQADGKIVVAGVATNSDNGFALARYNPGGSLDTSFSGDGKQAIGGGDFTAATGVAIQANGKIVAVGVCCGFHGGELFEIARFDPDGSIDPTFADGGIQTTSFRDSNDASAVAIQLNGKIVVAGDTTRDVFNAPYNYALARYNPNGSLDPTFSGDGKQATSIEGLAEGVALQANGKIVVVGNGGTEAVARYNPNGSLDTSFAGDGKRGFGGGLANAVAIQANGKIVVAGYAGGRGPTGDDFALARYNPNGSFDTSFSGDGERRTTFGDLDEAQGVAIQPNGRIVAAGFADTGARGETTDFALARYLGG